MLKNYSTILLAVGFIPLALAFECGWSTLLASSKSNSFEEADAEVRPEKKISNGRLASRIEKYPFLALVDWNVEGSWSSCTGVIYDKNTILTAGHCTDTVRVYLKHRDWDNLNYTNQVKVGASNESLEEGYLYEVKKSKPHRKFSRFESFNHDIGYVKIKGNFQWSSKVQPICIPNPNVSSTKLDWDSEIRVAGYGWIGDDRLTNGMLNVGKMTPYNYTLDPEDDRVGIIELRREGNSLGCPGDSGGPGFQLKNGRYYLYGVFSTSSASCSAGEISHLTSIQYNWQWIQDNIGAPQYF